MAVRAAERNAQSALGKLVCHCNGVLDGLVLQFLELLGLRQFERQRQRREYIDMRSALFTGEDGFVEFLGDVGFGGHQHCAAWTIERLVSRRHDHIRDADGGGNHARRHQTADVGNIGQKICADLIRNFAELLPIRYP